MKLGKNITDRVITQHTKFTLLFLSRGMHSTEARRKADAAVLITHAMVISLSSQLEEKLWGLNK